MRANPGEVTIVAVGRMTNLALALRDDPDIAALVKDVVIMGGAFDVPGNVTPAAEANIHGDPEAADVVMTAPWPVTVIGLDVTMKTVMTRKMMAEIAAAGGQRAETAGGDFRSSTSTSTNSMSRTAWSFTTAAPASTSSRPQLFSTRAAARSASSAAASPTARRSRKPTVVLFPPGAWDNLPSQDVCTGHRCRRRARI